MDTSETYIKMRLAAIPDMGMGIPMGFSINWQSEAILVDEKGDWYYSTVDETTQLERQDQLQEMAKEKLNKKVSLGTVNRPECILISGIYTLVEFCEKNGVSISTWEQLWFAFVMKEKYNKVWDGEKWADA